MGLAFIALLKNFVRVSKNGAKYAEGTIDGGGVTLKTSPHFSAPGDDSHPLIGDHPIAVSIPQHGGAAIVGYVDPKNAGITEPGEKRIYGRNVDGEPLGHLWLKNDGSLHLVTPTSSIVLTPPDGINASSIDMECDEQTNITANDTNIFGNVNVDIGVSGIAGPTSTITFINGIATAIT